MNVQALSPLRWNTASFATTGATVASDLSALGAHYRSCNGCTGRWFKVQCAIEAVHSFVAPRFVTTLFALGAAVTVAATAFL